jgi:hypothetical protein
LRPPNSVSSVRHGLHKQSSSAGPVRKIRHVHSPQEPRGGPSNRRGAGSPAGPDGKARQRVVVAESALEGDFCPGVDPW